MSAATFTHAPILRDSGGFLYELTTERGHGPENRWWAKIDTQHGNITEEEREALASLFAAAPEMFEALRRIAFEPFGDSEASHRDVLNAITDLARAALAKAVSP